LHLRKEFIQVKKPRRHVEKPPSDLSAEARRLFERIVADYAVGDSGGVTLIVEVCRALDRLNEARRILAADGLVQVDRFGQKKQHVCCAIERDAAQRLHSALRCLKLEPASVIDDRHE